LLRKAYLKELKNESPEKIDEIYQVTKKAVEDFDKSLESINLTTLQGLETYIIVKERLLEAEESLSVGEQNISSDELAYAIERYYSGVYWSNFFNMKGAKIQLNKEYLKQACYKKLSEADERINYAGIYIPVELQSAEETINQAYAFAAKENYKMCLFKASFAKAESNLLLSSLSIGSEHVDELADEKLKAVKKLIVKEESRGFFPIMGYSYYEYANSLNENDDAFSSLIFSEYALELGNIEIYFPKKGFDVSWVWAARSNAYLVVFFVSALVMGIIIGVILSAMIRNKKHKKELKVKRKPRK
jgi:predicted S18 family serine protease